MVYSICIYRIYILSRRMDEIEGIEAIYTDEVTMGETSETALCFKIQFEDSLMDVEVQLQTNPHD
jgi:hypothetical protein